MNECICCYRLWKGKSTCSRTLSHISVYTGTPAGGGRGEENSKAGKGEERVREETYIGIYGAMH